MSVRLLRHRTVRRAVAAVVGVAIVSSLSATPASAHASIPSAATFGFEPNPAGGTGALGTTPPYAPNAFTTISMRVPFEQTVPFNGSDDTTVDVKVTVPDGWTNPSCGPAKRQINTTATNSTNQPGADVPGWTCEVTDVGGRMVIHWAGPQVQAPANASDSAQFFVFSVTTPAPAAQTTYNGTNGTEGFITDQQYASGEIVHWIPNAAFPGTTPPGAETSVATGLVRTVAGPGSYFHPLSPTRLLDSRGAVGGWSSPLVAGTPRSLTVTGGAIPSDADSVVLNVTATGADTNSFLTVFPAGGTVPNASNLNFAPGQNVANLVVVKVGSAGQVTFANSLGSVHVVADVVGYYDAVSADRYNSLSPVRILDSRGSTGGFTGPLTNGAAQAVTVRGVAGVPNTADAVVMNVTATRGSTSSFVTAYPSGESLPVASNLNYAAGQNVANLVTVKIGADGKVAFANETGSVDVIADVVGYYDATSGDLFHSLPAGRILDSRLATGGWNGPLAAGTPRNLTVRGYGGVRTDANAVVANTTVTGPSAGGFLTVYPTGAALPNASTLNFVPNQNVPNLVAMRVGTGGQVSFNVDAGTAHVIFDVVGYFAAT